MNAVVAHRRQVTQLADVKTLPGPPLDGVAASSTITVVSATVNLLQASQLKLWWAGAASRLNAAAPMLKAQHRRGDEGSVLALDHHPIRAYPPPPALRALTSPAIWIAR